MWKNMFFGVLRHILTTAGGSLVGGGYLSNDELTLGVGAVITLVGVAWSAWDKKRNPEALPWLKAK